MKYKYAVVKKVEDGYYVYFSDITSLVNASNHTTRSFFDKKVFKYVRKEAIKDAFKCVKLKQGEVRENIGKFYKILNREDYLDE